MADPERARGGGVSHILAEKRGVSFTLLKKMHANAIFSLITGGGGRTPGTPYAGSATAYISLALFIDIALSAEPNFDFKCFFYQFNFFLPLWRDQLTVMERPIHVTE